MKTKLLWILSLFSLFSAAQTTNPAPWCAHEYDDGTATKVHYISSVQIGNFVNVSGPVQQPAPHYIFYNNLGPGNFVIGQNYTYMIQIDSMGDNRSVCIWYDWNQNGVNEVTETYSHYPVASGVSSVSGVMYVPFSASPGTSRLRIAITEDSTQNHTSFCTTTLDWGEAEDYEFIASLTADVNDMSGDHTSLSLFPNPVNDVLSLTTVYKGISKVYIYNLSGQCVFQALYDNVKTLEIALPDLPSGSYTASVQTGDRLTSKSFLKE